MNPMARGNRVRSERAEAAEIYASCACFNLRRTTRAITQFYDLALRPAHIRITQFSLLTLISGLGPVSIGRLADVGGMDHTTLVRNLRLLEHDGLVRSARGRDARVREIRLSERGRRTLAIAIPLWKRAQQRFAGKLGAARFRRLLDDLSASSTAAATA